MVTQSVESLAALYEADETAWLETMADLIRERRFNELDYGHLKEYLSDMARRDRKEVTSRLTVLLTHLLKWVHQPKSRSGSWRGTIISQRQELEDDVRGGVLRKHAEATIAQAYAMAVERAAAETGLPETTFPVNCPWSLDEALSVDVLNE
jgi:hypothetical protein